MIITDLSVQKNYLPEISHALRIYAHRVVRETSRQIVADSRAMMRTRKSGIRYPKQSMPRTSSAPGEAPAIQTSELYHSLRAEPVSHLVWRALTDVDYAPYLEFGTTQMAPRPFFTPAAHDNYLRFVAYFQKFEEICLTVVS